jgi:hypothetical protein
LRERPHCAVETNHTHSFKTAPLDSKNDKKTRKKKKAHGSLESQRMLRGLVRYSMQEIVMANVERVNVSFVDSPSFSQELVTVLAVRGVLIMEGRR